MALINNHSTNTLEEFLNVLREHEIKTSNKYVCIKSDKTFSETKFIPKGKIRVNWNGTVPYFCVGRRVYACHRGKDTNLYQKNRHAEKRDSQGGLIQRRTLFQPTKKLNCPVIINVSLVLLLPEFEVSKSTHSEKGKMSEIIKGKIEEGEEIVGESLYCFNIPDEISHQCKLAAPVTKSACIQKTNTSFNLGDRFTSFIGFQGALEIFKLETNSDFYIYDSKTLQASAKRAWRRVQHAPECLKYLSIKYRCVHGGAFRRNKTSRHLRDTSTLKVGCEVFIYLLLSDDSQALVIQSMYLEHNHDAEGARLQAVRTSGPKMRIKTKDVKETKQKSINREKYLVRQRISEESADEDMSFPVSQDSTSLDAPNEDAQMPGMYETMMMNPGKNTLPEGIEWKSGSELCRCGIGTWELTKQDLMLMEVEEHHQRLEILQLQEAYQIERIEKMRYLQELKIRKAEQELTSEMTSNE